MRNMGIKENFTGLQHIGIPTNDIDGMISFYQIIGFETVLKTLNKEANEAVAFLKLGNLVIEAYENHNAKMIDGSINHFAVNVKSIDAAYRFICENDLNNTNDEIHYLPFWENGVKFFTILGPNMERIEFSQYL